ncbi:Sugar phosphate permease [Halorubrum aquaticum]|uniref:Sugar phosphate permease n=1 Tax=Halorubrum aquaticum TaxID=387340 RepID=A0A1I3CWM6_9EURY|nr:MFS transporter [Halorubrum aquaticum]SFH78910.1 Sugar phosphate permease [Halorubrum aquaticum]
MRTNFRRIAAGVDGLRGDPRTPVLIAVAGGWFLSLGVRLVYPAVIPHLRTAYGISLSTAGLLLTVLWLAYAVGQLPGGVLSDRFGERAVLVTSTLVSGAVLGLVVVAAGVELLFAATALFGLSTALYGVSRFTILSAVYPDNDGTAIGVTMAAGDLGNTVLPPVAGFLAVTFAWQFGFAFAIPGFLLAAVGLFVTLPRSNDGSDPADPSASTDDAPSAAGTGTLQRAVETGRTVADALRTRPVILVTAIQTLAYCAWQAFTGFYPTYLIDVKGLAPTTATLLFGGFFAMGVAVKPVTGRAYDLYGARRTLPVVLTVATASLATLPFVASLPGLAVLTLGLSALLGYSTATLSYLTSALPSAVRGSGLGVLRTGYMAVGAGSPVVAGALADAGFFDEVFLLSSALALVAAGCCPFLPRGAPRT